MNDKQMLEQAIENAQDVVARLEEQYKERYGKEEYFRYGLCSCCGECDEEQDDE